MRAFHFGTVFATKTGIALTSAKEPLIFDEFLLFKYD
jgi:hypothetical protein